MDDYPQFDEVAAAEEILIELRRRRQRLQLREAKQGDNTDPEVIGEIEALTTRITAQEAELLQLETRAAVDNWSLAEAKYRELLAEAWSDVRGCPTVVGAERLERVRLELGIKRERAQELERDIRAKLAMEVFRAINPEQIHRLFGRDLANNGCTEVLQQIGRSIRLDPSAAAELFRLVVVASQRESLETLYGLRELLLRANPQWPESNETQLFQDFLRRVAETIALHPCAAPVTPPLWGRPGIWNS